MKVAVVGSGHAALSAAETLIERGYRPTLFDVGETLPEDVSNLAAALAARPAEDWARNWDAAVSLTSARAGGPRSKTQKTVFGSEFLFGRDRAFAPIDAVGTDAAPSFAKGGFSMGWGGTLLSARPEDLTDWPVGAAELEAYYPAALDSLPFAASEDALGDVFPLFHDNPLPNPPTEQGRQFLTELARAASATRKVAGDRIVIGGSRLAVRMDECLTCGMCLTGCPAGLIHTLDRDVDALVRQDAISYRPGCFVESYRETTAGIILRWQDLATGSRDSARFDKLFIGAGALGTPRIVAAAHDGYGHKLPLLDSGKFVLPVVGLAAAPFAWPNINTLADGFAEAVFASVSPHWLHGQLSPVNEIMLRTLYLANGHKLSLLGRLLRPLAARLMAVWCGMHSSLSTTGEIVLEPGAGDVPRLRIAVETERTPGNVAAYTRHWARLARDAGAVILSFARVVSPAFSTGHCGGTFPMRDDPEGWFHTDRRGRPSGTGDVHLVDASVFPSIPGTTIALLIRANARRIVSEATSD